MKFWTSFFCIASVILVEVTNAFAPQSPLFSSKRSTAVASSSALLPDTSVGAQPPSKDSNFWIPPEKLRFKVLKFGKGGKLKILNLYGLWVILVSLLTFPPWILALSLEQIHGKINKKWDENRSVFDKIGKIWSRVWLKMIGSYPTQSGKVEMLKGKGIGPCLYVANHGSWLDIAIICTVVQPVFKFIAKGDLKHVPGIGQQLRGVRYVTLRSKWICVFFFVSPRWDNFPRSTTSFCYAILLVSLGEAYSNWPRGQEIPIEDFQRRHCMAQKGGAVNGLSRGNKVQDWSFAEIQGRYVCHGTKDRCPDCSP